MAALRAELHEDFGRATTAIIETMRAEMRALLEPHDGVPERVTKLEELPAARRAARGAGARAEARRDGEPRGEVAPSLICAPLCRLPRGHAVHRSARRQLVGSRAMALTLYVGSKRYSSWSLRPYLALAQTGAARSRRATILLDQQDTKAKIAAVDAGGRACRCCTTATS